MVEVHFTPWKEIHPSPLCCREMTVWCRDGQKVKVLAVVLRECIGRKREGKEREQVSQHIVLNELNMWSIIDPKKGMVNFCEHLPEGFSRDHLRDWFAIECDREVSLSKMKNYLKGMIRHQFELDSPGEQVVFRSRSSRPFDEWFQLRQILGSDLLD